MCSCLELWDNSISNRIGGLKMAVTMDVRIRLLKNCCLRTKHTLIYFLSLRLAIISSRIKPPTIPATNTHQFHSMFILFLCSIVQDLCSPEPATRREVTCFETGSGWLGCQSPKSAIKLTWPQRGFTAWFRSIMFTFHL